MTYKHKHCRLEFHILGIRRSFLGQKSFTQFYCNLEMYFTNICMSFYSNLEANFHPDYLDLRLRMQYLLMGRPELATPLPGPSTMYFSDEKSTTEEK